MPLPKKRRDDLLSSCADSSKVTIFNYEDWQPSMTGAELRTLLESDEQLEGLLTGTHCVESDMVETTRAGFVPGTRDDYRKFRSVGLRVVKKGA